MGNNVTPPAGNYVLTSAPQLGNYVIADNGILAVHETINGLTREKLIERIATERGRHKDIKAVWSQWEYKPSKVDLAHALWPTLERKIQWRLADNDAPTPEIAEVIWEAYLIAQQWRYVSFVLRAEEKVPKADPAR